MRDLINAEFDDGGLGSALVEAMRRIGAPRDLLARLGAVLESQIGTRFETKRDPDGDLWDQLRPSTQEAYERRFKGDVPGTLLDRSFDGPGMRNSLASNLVADDAVEVGMSRFYALFHEMGAKRMARRGMFFGDPDAGRLGADDEAALDEAVADFLDGLFGAN